MLSQTFIDSGALDLLISLIGSPDTEVRTAAEGIMQTLSTNDSAIRAKVRQQSLAALTVTPHIDFIVSWQSYCKVAV